VSAAAAPPAFSVVICAYTEDRWDDLVRAVASVQRQTLPATEIVVVIDGDGALLDRARRALPGVTAIPNHQRPGLAGARNSGALATTGAVVAYLDDDAHAAPDWLAELAKAYETPSVLGVGGHLEPVWATRRPDWFPEEFDWVVGCTYRGVPSRPARVRNPIGANMSVLREVLDAVGGFRPEMGRLEETDFCIRAQARFPGRYWLHWPSARVSHAVTPRRETWGFFVDRCRNEGIAKATMVQMTSRRAGLASERSYVRRTLPAGVARNLGAGLAGDPAGFKRATAIVVGLGATAGGYLRGRAALSRSSASGEGIARRGANP
jgi:glycosyltransferase involved in cell wall biosynthesis